MIIWQGLGFIVPLVLIGILALVEAMTEAALHDDQYYQEHGWPILVGFCLTAVVIWRLASKLNARRGRTVIDKATGEEFEIKPRHSLFFIKMEYWPPILVVIGVVAFFVM